MRYVISDIHGEYSLFIELMKKIGFSENDELFKARLRAMYMQSETSTWEVLLGSESFAEFIKKSTIDVKFALSSVLFF